MSFSTKEIRGLQFLLISGLILNLTGCVGYRLGSMVPKDIQTVYVPTVVNATTEPLIEIETTRALTREIQTDGSLRVADEHLADATLTVTINEFKLGPLSFDNTTRTRANEYRLTMVATVVLVNNKTGKRIVSTRAVGKNTFEFRSDLTTAKRTALPLAASDLAHNVVEAIVEYWDVEEPTQ